VSYAHRYVLGFPTEKDARDFYEDAGGTLETFTSKKLVTHGPHAFRRVVVVTKLAPLAMQDRVDRYHGRILFYDSVASRKNPTGVLATGVELAVQELVLIGVGALAAGVVGYLLWQKYGLNAEQSQEAATQELTGGYPPAPGSPTTIPNPSAWSGANPVTPWTPIGPPA